jgi:hypothetical protein
VEPALSVNTSKMIARLNAELLGGRRVRDFATRSSVYTKDKAAARFAGTGAHRQQWTRACDSGEQHVAP